MEQIIYSLPGDLLAIAGGTRTDIKLTRPWQQPIVNGYDCVFCKPRDRVSVIEDYGDWILLRNRFTPYEFHNLIIPDLCWSDDQLRNLGGVKQIQQVFQHIKPILHSFSYPLHLSVHIGALAGQNIPHLHWHLLRYQFNPEQTVNAYQNWVDFFNQHSNLQLWSKRGIMCGIGGIRAGQCVFLPNPIADPGQLAEAIAEVLQLYNHKFRSTQNLPPDFNLSLKFIQGRFSWGIYTPILNHWGGAESMSIYEPGTHITLPWPHEATVEYLLSD